MIYLPTPQQNVHHYYHCLHQRAINQLLKFASYHTQIINVLLLQSLRKLMGSKLEQFITLGTF